MPENLNPCPHDDRVAHIPRQLEKLRCLQRTRPAVKYYDVIIKDINNTSYNHWPFNGNPHGTSVVKWESWLAAACHFCVLYLSVTWLSHMIESHDWSHDWVTWLVTWLSHMIESHDWVTWLSHMTGHMIESHDWVTWIVTLLSHMIESHDWVTWLSHMTESHDWVTWLVTWLSHMAYREWDTWRLEMIRCVLAQQDRSLLPERLCSVSSVTFVVSPVPSAGESTESTKR